MYVCICNAVTEKQVNEAIDAGAKTVKALNSQLGIATQCGSCVGCAKACLAKARKQKSENKPTNVFSISKQAAA